MKDNNITEAEKLSKILNAGERERREAHELQKVRNKEMKNPRNYPAFDIEGLRIYAVN